MSNLTADSLSQTINNQTAVLGRGWSGVRGASFNRRLYLCRI